MRPSVKDVAQLAGVSPMTVSNVVNGTKYVAPATRARVEEAVRTLGYRPNASARRLRSGRSGIVALAVPKIEHAYFAELAGLVIEAAETHSWTVLIDQTGGTREHERMVLSGLREQLIDGLILFPQSLTRRDVTERTGSVPVVMLGDHGRAENIDTVVIDNVAAASAATRHLIDLGRTRIAAIGARRGRGASDVERLRTRGFQDAVRGAGLPLDEHWRVAATSFTRAEGARAMSQLLDLPEPPDAVFCLNDTLALGALHVALTRGLSVPGDLAILGFDDVEDGRYSNPPLSTVAPDKQRIATAAADLLHRRMRYGSAAPPERYVAGYRLLPRATTSG
ncbi:MAG: LacI family DNA-binding transcriptional regulator [Micromonosporaceae bacterium]